MSISHWRYTVPLRLRSLFRRRQVEEELDEELRCHLEQLIEEGVAKGMSAEAARQAALYTMDGLELRKEECRDARRVRVIEDMARDLRYSLRLVRRNPGFTAVAVVILALGIGANAAMFSILDRLFLRQPPQIRDAENVFVLNLGVEDGSGREERFPSTTSYPLFTAVRDSLDPVSETAAFSNEEAGYGRGTASEEINVVLASGTYFPLLGVRPYLGRFFTEDEAGSVVLDYYFWKRAFHGDPSVIGKDCWINNHPFPVAAVAPSGFTGAFLKRIDAWLPLAAAAPYVMPRPTLLKRFDVSLVFVLARPRGGVPVEQIRTAAAAAGGGARLLPLATRTSPLLAGSARISLWATALSALVLLIACANVANLILLRGLQRRTEIAVRLQLGMDRFRLLRQLLTESLVLTVLGGAAALLVMNWAILLVSPALLDHGFSFAELMDIRVLAFMAAAILVSTVLTGLAAAHQATRVRMQSALRGAGSGITQGGGKYREALVIIQVALAGIMLVGSTLFLRSFWKVSGADLGFDARHVLAVRLSGLRQAGYSAEQVHTFYTRMYAMTRSLSGVESTSLTTSLPPGNAMALPFTVPGKALPGEMPLTHVVTSDYFKTMGMSLLKGRGFGEADGSKSPRVVVVNEEMARKIWPGEDALGKCMMIGIDRECATVIGVVEDAALWLVNGRPAQAQYYILLDQFNRYMPPGSLATLPDRLILLVRTHEQARLQSALTREIKAQAGTSFVGVRTLDSLFDDQRRSWRTGAIMFGLLGLLALGVATGGVFGQLNYLVKSRKHEIGVRMALGACPADIMKLIVTRCLLLVGAGTAIGLAAGLALSQWVRSLLFEIAPQDPVSFAAVAVLLAAVALGASVIPARRAANSDPAAALRHE